MDCRHSNWKTIRLELAQTTDFPEGSPSRAYFVEFPLSEDGQVDQEAISTAAVVAKFRRHWASDPDETGEIRQVGRNWALCSAGKGDRILRLEGQPFHLGQQISLVEDDGAVLPLKIVSVR